MCRTYLHFKHLYIHRFWDLEVYHLIKRAVGVIALTIWGSVQGSWLKVDSAFCPSKVSKHEYPAPGVGWVGMCSMHNCKLPRQCFKCSRAVYRHHALLIDRNIYKMLVSETLYSVLFVIYIQKLK